jgi:hypothetical protein
MGLIVPPGSSIRVGTEERSWQEGTCFVFDDIDDVGPMDRTASSIPDLPNAR